MARRSQSNKKGVYTKLTLKSVFITHEEEQYPLSWEEGSDGILRQPLNCVFQEGLKSMCAKNLPHAWVCLSCRHVFLKGYNMHNNIGNRERNIYPFMVQCNPHGMNTCVYYRRQSCVNHYHFV